LEPTTPLQDQLANVSPIWVVAIVAAFTLVRVALAKIKDPWARTVSETCDTVNFVLILAFLLIRPFVAQAFYIPSESMESTLLVHDRLVVNKFTYRFTQPHHGDVVVFEAPPEATGGKEGVDFIKRLIGEPHDTIQVTAAKMLIGGSEVNMNGEADNLHDYLRLHLSLKDSDSVKIFPDHILVNGTEKFSKERIAELLGQPGAEVVLRPGEVLLNGKMLDEPYTREDPDYDYPSNGEPPVQLDDDHYFMMGDNRNHSADSHAWGPLERRRVVGKAIFVFWPPTRMGVIH
jgi:signal peptidase I